MKKSLIRTRLGAGRQTIWKRMRAGKLQAVCLTRGKHRGLLVKIDPDEDMPLLSGPDPADAGPDGDEG